MKELIIKCPYRDCTDIEYGYIYCLNSDIKNILCYLCELEEGDVID